MFNQTFFEELRTKPHLIKEKDNRTLLFIPCFVGGSGNLGAFKRESTKYIKNFSKELRQELENKAQKIVKTFWRIDSFQEVKKFEDKYNDERFSERFYRINNKWLSVQTFIVEFYK